MLPSGHSNPMGGAQPVPSSLLRSNSGMLGGQGGSMSSQGGFPSLIPPRPHYNNVNMLGNVQQSLLNQSFGNGVVDPGHQGPNGQRGGMDAGGAEPDPLSGVGGGGMGYNPSQSSYVPTNMVNAVSSSQVQGQQYAEQSGNQMLTDQQPSNSQQLEPQNFQQPQQPMRPFSNALNNQLPQQQQQFRSIRGGMSGVGPVKLEAQVNSDHQHGLQQQQQLQSLRGLGNVKLEAQQLQPMRSHSHVKMEPQHSEQSMYMQQQQQQQQLLLSRQSPQAAAAAQISLLQQHRLLQLQQQQQQQLLQAHPQQRPQMQQQFQAQNLPMRSPVKPVHEVGACARRVTQYIYQQRNRPEDNNIDFWRKFVAEFFAPNSKKKWCVSMYGSGRQTTGVFPQDVWQCEICNRKPGRGFEATFEVLPRLFKIKYESGTLEELLYVDMPREYHNPSGQIVLDYAKAIQESVFEQLRVVRDGQLRIVFSPDLKICSWEFCARRHEELIPRRLLIPQVSQLGAATQKYQAATQNASSNASVSDLQGNCNMFLASARQLAKALEAPSVNDLGYTKRYVRCLQISEVVNSMKDLIDYSRVTRTGPIDSLAKFPRRNVSSGFETNNQPSEDQQQQQSQQHPPNQSMQQQQQQPPPSQMMQQQQPRMQNSNVEQASDTPSASRHPGMQQLATSNGLPRVNNPLNTSSASTPAMNPSNSCYATTSMPSPVSTATMQPSPSQSNPPFRSPTPPPPLNNSPRQPPSNTANSPANVSMQQQPLMSNGDPTNSQSSVQKIIQEMMLSSQLNGPGGMNVSSLGTDVKNVNGMLPSNHSSLNGPNCLVGNGPTNGNPGVGFSGMGQAASMLNGVRATIGGNAIAMNGRVGMGRDQGIGHHQQHDLSNQLSGYGSANGFNNLQFDWKPSP